MAFTDMGGLGYYAEVDLYILQLFVSIQILKLLCFKLSLLTANFGDKVSVVLAQAGLEPSVLLRLASVELHLPEFPKCCLPL